MSSLSSDDSHSVAATDPTPLIIAAPPKRKLNFKEVKDILATLPTVTDSDAPVTLTALQYKTLVSSLEHEKRCHDDSVKRSLAETERLTDAVNAADDEIGKLKETIAALKATRPARGGGSAKAAPRGGAAASSSSVSSTESAPRTRKPTMDLEGIKEFLEEHDSLDVDTLKSFGIQTVRDFWWFLHGAELGGKHNYGINSVPALYKSVIALHAEWVEADRPEGGIRKLVESSTVPGYYVSTKLDE